MLPPATAAGGREGSIRKPPGPLIHATMNRFVEPATAGGKQNEEGKPSQKKTRK